MKSLTTAGMESAYRGKAMITASASRHFAAAVAWPFTLLRYAYSTVLPGVAVNPSIKCFIKIVVLLPVPRGDPLQSINFIAYLVHGSVGQEGRAQG